MYFYEDEYLPKVGSTFAENAGSPTIKPLYVRFFENFLESEINKFFHFFENGRDFIAEKNALSLNHSRKIREFIVK